MVISEMLLPLHCVINKSVNLPRLFRRDRTWNPWAPAHLGISCIYAPCPAPEHTPHTSQVKNFPFVPLLPPALRWRHSWGLGLGWCPLQLHCCFSGKQELSPAGLHPSGCHQLGTRCPCSAVKTPQAEVYLAKSFLLL